MSAFSVPTWRTSAFSMAELMIAIVILGLGLLMVATMFPVAWTRARDMAEFTTHSGAIDAAHYTVDAMSVIALPDGSVDHPTFVGDLAGDDPPAPGVPEPFGDPTVGEPPQPPGVPLVHYLSMWTQLATNPGSPTAVQSDFLDSTGGIIAMDQRLATAGGFVAPYDAYTVAAIGVHQRVIPPLSSRPPNSGIPADAVAQARWDEQLSTRRFAWAAFNRFDRVPTNRSDVRSLTMYYVTLRRPQATYRYARQDPLSDPVLACITPKALGSTEDVRFPIPWLVYLDVRGSWDPMGAPLPQAPTGIPSEAIANPTGVPVSRLIAQMLQPGSILIDRITGAVYTVTSHRFRKTGAFYDYSATVTLDREILVSDIVTPEIQQLFPGPLQVQVGTVAMADNPAIDPPTADGTIRAFWTFPPPVLRGDGAPDEYPTFDGKQPVVGFETRTLIKRP